MCRFLARYGVCFHSGRTRIDALCCESLCACALHMACSKALVSLYGWNPESERVVPVQAVFVMGLGNKS